MGKEKTFQDNFSEVLKTIETQTASFIEGVAENFVGKADGCRKASHSEVAQNISHLQNQNHCHRTEVLPICNGPDGGDVLDEIRANRGIA